MSIVSDLHLHSKYSRAVSPHMTLQVMAEMAKKKGLDLLTTSDWTHPEWFQELKHQLSEHAEGIYTLKNDKAENPTKFLLSTEIASIYKQGEKLRRIHSLVFVPDLDTAEKVIMALLHRGANLSSDGRPIIGLSVKNLLELVLEVDERCMLIPCHVWTPHFGLYGSASGFDSLDEAFGDLASYIYGIETGLSSDPEMNWQIPELRSRSIMSFSDAHSPAKMGREATVFALTDVTYENVSQAIMRPSRKSIKSIKSIKGIKGKEIGKTIDTPDTPDTRDTPDTSRILYTIEFYPEEGKYHFSGHRNCKVAYGPKEITEKGEVCPVCHRRMTEGVMHRVQAVAENEFIPGAFGTPDKNGVLWLADKEKIAPPYIKLVSLLTIVAESMRMTVMSKKVQQTYDRLFQHFPSELDILLNVSVDELQKFAGEEITRGIMKVRTGDLTIRPGYDGEYGKVKLWSE